MNIYLKRTKALAILLTVIASIFCHNSITLSEDSIPVEDDTSIDSDNSNKDLMVRGSQETTADDGIGNLAKEAIKYALIALFVIAITLYIKEGFVFIKEGEVGIVLRRVSLNLSFRKKQKQLFARGFEAGYLAKTVDIGISWYAPWIHKVEKVKEIVIQGGEIGLVLAQDGESIETGRILGKKIECENFTDGKAFLECHGERGRQIDFLTEGTYRVNTRLFTVITTSNVESVDDKLTKNDLKVYEVLPNNVGIVNTLDGKAHTNNSEILGLTIKDHDHFQDGQKFIDNGGFRGLQEEVLLPGTWKINPWLVTVKQVPFVTVLEGTVGVIVSLAGKIPLQKTQQKINNKQLKAELGYDLVDPGFRGVLKTTLDTGKHAINTEIYRVVLVPIHQITLDWSDKIPKSENNYDRKLGTLKLRSNDGFLLNVEVRQRFRISKENAPKIISQIGSPSSKNYEDRNQSKFQSIHDLIVRVLEPIVSAYFYNAVQTCSAKDFHKHRSDQQREARDYLASVLHEIGIEAIDTLIGEVDLPDSLETLETGITIEQSKRELLKEEIITEQVHTELEIARQRTAQIKDLVKHETSIQIAKYKAEAKIQDAIANARSMREQGQAQADVEKALRQSIVDILGKKAYIEIEKLKPLSDFKFPTIIGESSNSSSTQLIDVIIYTIMSSLSDENYSNYSVSQINELIPNLLFRNDSKDENQQLRLDISDDDI